MPRAVHSVLGRGQSGTLYLMSASLGAVWRVAWRNVQGGLQRKGGSEKQADVEIVGSKQR